MLIFMNEVKFLIVDGRVGDKMMDSEIYCPSVFA